MLNKREMLIKREVTIKREMVVEREMVVDIHTGLLASHLLSFPIGFISFLYRAYNIEDKNTIFFDTFSIVTIIIMNSLIFYFVEDNKSLKIIIYVLTSILLSIIFILINRLSELIIIERSNLTYMSDLSVISLIIAVLCHLLIVDNPYHS